VRLAPVSLSLPAGSSDRRSRSLAVAGILAGCAAVLVTLPPLLVETPLVPGALCLAALVLGAAAMLDGARFLGSYAILAAFFGLVVALVVQGASKSTVEAVVTAGLFAGTLQYMTPLAYAALGGLYSERAGVVNIALEGMMLTGAFFAVLVGAESGSWWLGVLAGVAAATALALLHAVFAIHLRADQIVTGTAINIIGLGLTTYLFRSIYQGDSTAGGGIPTVPDVTLPGVRSLPGVGGVFGTVDVLIWLMFALVIVSWAVLFKTPWGLHLRAVGEHPRAADTVGVNVFAIRYAAVLISGALAGLGGAYLSLGFAQLFNENMTAGRGFIALAALIFGKWKPFGLLGATALFAFAEALGDNLQAASGISSDLVQMLPYVLTLVALVGLVGRSIPPAASGRPYQRQ
jgi:ABC-type uncharacterized transport system permease subunit